MHKLFRVALLSVVSTTFAQAQTITPRIGIVVSSTTMDEISTAEQTSSVSSKTGYTFGVGYNKSITTLGKGMLSIQPELTYIQKGYNAKTSGEINIGEGYYQYNGDSDFKINYFEIPVLVKYEIGSDKIKVAMFAGPSIGFGLGGKYKTIFNSDTGEGGMVSTKTEGDIVFYRPETNSNATQLDHNIDFGLQGGAAITLFNRLTIDARYGHGLTNVNHKTESKNKVFQFGVSVPLNLN